MKQYKYIDYYCFLDLMYRSDCSTREKIEEIANRCVIDIQDTLKRKRLVFDAIKAAYRQGVIDSLDYAIKTDDDIMDWLDEHTNGKKGD